MDPSEAAKAFVTLIALVNPVGVAPIYLGLVGDRAAPERSAIARTAAIGVATRIFGPLLVAMGVEFVAKGFQVLWPGLLR